MRADAYQELGDLMTRSDELEDGITDKKTYDIGFRIAVLSPWQYQGHQDPAKLN